MKQTLFKQTWWVTLALMLAALQVVFAVGIGLDSEASGTERIVIFSVWAGGAALVMLGADRRYRRRRTGDALIALGVVPSVAVGIIAYWFPPMWLVAAAGLTVIVVAVRDSFGSVAVAGA